MIYAVYDFHSDTWYLLGAYQTSSEVIEFYQTMLRAPFWNDRLSALYIVGSFDMDTGVVTPCEKTRIMMGGKSVSEVDTVSEVDDYSEGAGGESSPQNEQSEKTSKRFSIIRRIFGSVRND